MSKKESNRILRLYPEPYEPVCLKGLYLNHFMDIYKRGLNNSFVYTNFIASLDGRIAVQNPENGRQFIPSTITNPSDWRLYQELAAISDAVILTANFIRHLNTTNISSNIPISTLHEYDDLIKWRIKKGLMPQPVLIILSKSHDIPEEKLQTIANRTIYIVTDNEPEKLQKSLYKKFGVNIIGLSNKSSIKWSELIDKLREIGLRNIYSVAGPNILSSLLSDGYLDRLYLTQVNKMISGKFYKTISEGDELNSPFNLSLSELYYDNSNERDFSQLFYVYNKIS